MEGGSHGGNVMGSSGLHGPTDLMVQNYQVGLKILKWFN